jgi:hypothetical protein
VALGVRHEIDVGVEIHARELVVVLLAAEHAKGVVLQNTVVSIVGNDDRHVDVVTGRAVYRLRVVEVGTVADEPDDVPIAVGVFFGDGRTDRRREAVSQPAAFVGEILVGLELHLPPQGDPARHGLVDDERIIARLAEFAGQLRLRRQPLRLGLRIVVVDPLFDRFDLPETLFAFGGVDPFGHAIGDRPQDATRITDDGNVGRFVFPDLPRVVAYVDQRGVVGNPSAVLLERVRVGRSASKQDDVGITDQVRDCVTVAGETRHPLVVAGRHVHLAHDVLPVDPRAALLCEAGGVFDGARPRAGDCVPEDEYGFVRLHERVRRFGYLVGVAVACVRDSSQSIRRRVGLVSHHVRWQPEKDGAGRWR